MLSALPPEDRARIAIALAIFGFLFLAGLVADIHGIRWLRKNRGEWEERSLRLLRRPWERIDGLRVFLPLGLLFASIWLLSFLFMDRLSALDGTARYLTLLVPTTAIQLVAVGAIAVAMKRRGIRAQSGFTHPHGSPLRATCMGCYFYLASMPLVLFLAIAGQSLFTWFGLEPAPQDVVNLLVDAQGDTWFNVYLVMLAVIAAPAVEELIFRGIALPIIAKRYGVIPALLLVSMLFAMIHFHLTSLAPLFAVAMFLGLGALVSGSIVTPIVAHALFNASNVGIILLIKDVDLTLL